MTIKSKLSSGLKSVSAGHPLAGVSSARSSSALIGSAVPAGVQTAINGLPFRRNPFPFGASYVLKGGTTNADTISVTGPIAAFAGPGDDSLTGLSRLSADKQWTIYPFLSGGPGNDRYTVNNRQSAVIADMNGGDDTAFITALGASGVRYMVVNTNDLMITDGSTSVLLLDPLGAVSPVNKLETVVINGVSKSIDKFFDEVPKSSAFVGGYTYPNLHRIGMFNYSDFVSDPADMNEFVKGPQALNNLMIF